MNQQSVSNSATDDLPLTGVRIIEMTDGKGEMCGRILADLGAEVILIEPPEGLSSRKQAPLFENISLYFASHNANKRSVVLDLHNKKDTILFLQLIESADIFIEANRPKLLDSLNLGIPVLHQSNPQLVILSMTDFGQTGPYKDYLATDAVHIAMAGVLCRSGLPNKPPLLPPGQLAIETASIQAAWAVMISYWQRLEIGVGDHLDFSFFEGTAQILDPILGVTGSAAAGKSSLQLAPSRDRPAAGNLYPIFSCTDGFVRMCILNPRQWQGMSAWLGNEHPFTDPIYDNIFKRFSVMDDIIQLIEKLTNTLTISEAVNEGQQRGIPIAALSSPSEVLKNDHFLSRGAFTSIKIKNHEGVLPSGYLEINGKRAGIRQQAPSIGQHTNEILSGLTTRKPQVKKITYGSNHRPLAGIRVLDLGVIVAGAELGRIMSDQGAEVIKVENRAFPDGNRQSGNKDQVSFSFTQGHRGKESLGINLRTTKGIELFKQLAVKSDVILSNFKPETMESLGIGYDVIKKINPAIIMADSSALGCSGPLSKSMGYGPLVRASTGLTGLWRYPDDKKSFSDGVTILPDHFAARVSAIGLIALLCQRKRTHLGGTVSVSQAETILTALSTEFLNESLQAGAFHNKGNDNQYSAPNGVFACAGDDEWCVIAVRNDKEWAQLCQVIARKDLLADINLATNEGRIKNRDYINKALTQWTSQYAPDVVMQSLQDKGIAAGKMFRLPEFEHNPHLLERNFFGSIQQEGHDEIWPTENTIVLSKNLPNPDIRSAPKQGQHTRQIISRVLGLNDQGIQQLIDSGDLEEMEN